jgi:hypothetical protein
VVDEAQLRKLAQMRRSLEAQRVGRAQLVIPPSDQSGLRIIE